MQRGRPDPTPNYYRGGLLEPAVVEVALPTGSFITGGRYIIIQGRASSHPSGGSYAADLASRMNYGFNVKYNKNKTNLQGHANIIFRQGGKTYQIKSNATESLGITLKKSTGAACSGPPSSDCWGLAEFRSKANLTDVTDPGAPASLGGGFTLHLTLTDKGEPGKSDMIGVTLWDGNTLLFSSQWNGAKTLEKLIDGGNLVVH